MKGNAAILVTARRSILAAGVIILSACAEGSKPAHGVPVMAPRSAATQASLDSLFETKPPWAYPQHARTPDLDAAIELALRDYRGPNASTELRAREVYFDESRDYFYLTFDSRTVSDTYVVYVYEASTRHLLGPVILHRS